MNTLPPAATLRSAPASRTVAAESVEGRGSTKRNALQQATDRTQRRNSVSFALCGVREAARWDKRMRFTALLHHITPALLLASFLDLKRQAAPGLDGVTRQDYYFLGLASEVELLAHLEKLKPQAASQL